MRPPSTHATCAAAILWPLELPQAHFVLMASNSSDGPEVPEAPGVSGSSDGPGVPDEKVGKSYTCSTCKEKFYKSTIFVLGDDPAIDWQGDTESASTPGDESAFDPSKATLPTNRARKVFAYTAAGEKVGLAGFEQDDLGFRPLSELGPP